MIYDCISDKRTSPRTPSPPRSFNITESNLLVGGTLVSEATLDAYLDSEGVDTENIIPLIIDIEGSIRDDLYSPLPWEREAAQAIFFGAQALVNAVRPGFPVAFYGLPRVQVGLDWQNQSAVDLWAAQEGAYITEVITEADFIAPAFYWQWLGGTTWTSTTRPLDDFDAMCHKVATKLAPTQMAIVPFIMGIFHGNSDPSIAYTQIPATQMSAMITHLNGSYDNTSYWGRLMDSTPDKNAAVLANFDVARGA